MDACYNNQLAGAPPDFAAGAYRRAPFGRGFGPPPAVKALAVIGAFLIFPPLGVAALGYFLWRSARNGGFGPHAPLGRAQGPAGAGNSALEERRREVLRTLDDEAKAFAEFERRRREARDKEAFDRFMADQANRNQGGADRQTP